MNKRITITNGNLY